MDRLDAVVSKTTRRALIRATGVQKAIANDPLASGHGRPDETRNVIGSRCPKQQRLSFKAPPLARGIQQQLSDGLRPGRSTGLAGQHTTAPLPLEIIGEQASLRGFTRTLPTFESYEAA